MVNQYACHSQSVCMTQLESVHVDSHKHGHHNTNKHLSAAQPAATQCCRAHPKGALKQKAQKVVGVGQVEPGLVEVVVDVNLLRVVPPAGWAVCTGQYTIYMLYISLYLIYTLHILSLSYIVLYIQHTLCLCISENAGWIRHPWYVHSVCCIMHNRTHVHDAVGLQDASYQKTSGRWYPLMPSTRPLNVARLGWMTMRPVLKINE